MQTLDEWKQLVDNYKYLEGDGAVVCAECACVWDKQHTIGCIAKAFSDAIEQIEGLQDYAKHKYMCVVDDMGGVCSCGLDALLEEREREEVSNGDY